MKFKKLTYFTKNYMLKFQIIFYITISINFYEIL